MIITFVSSLLNYLFGTLCINKVEIQCAVNTHKSIPFPERLEQ